MDDRTDPARLRMDVRERAPAVRRVPRIALYAGWTVVGVLLWVLAPGSLGAVLAGLHWVLGICAVVMAATMWNSPARVGGIPVRLGMLGVAAVFLALAALQTYAVLT